MSQMRVNFLNWRPDIDDFPNGGLLRAENCVHEPEGYKPIYLQDSVSQTGNLSSVASIAVKPVGAQGDLLCAWVTNDSLYVGINGETASPTGTASPPAFTDFGSIVSGTGIITAFDVCELAGLAFFTVEALGTSIVPSQNITLSASGYATV
ncbi:MAG: hypothetical protein AAGE92_00050 [Cyanobacteria bacterium P01_G01_bin.4]